LYFPKKLDGVGPRPYHEMDLIDKEIYLIESFGNIHVPILKVNDY
jgi:hypothetical protein